MHMLFHSKSPLLIKLFEYLVIRYLCRCCSIAVYNTTLESVFELSSCMSCVKYLHCMNKLGMAGIYDVFYIAESIIHVHATLLNFNTLVCMQVMYNVFLFAFPLFMLSSPEFGEKAGQCRPDCQMCGQIFYLQSVMRKLSKD